MELNYDNDMILTSGPDFQAYDPTIKVIQQILAWTGICLGLLVIACYLAFKNTQ